ncbi:MAG: hypothetical protein J7K33_11920 [Candidatus Marinimicrobia bacterium]|nr:hypothetical protein [Candidatus Neomarinimicrobiota bacterium]
MRRRIKILLCSYYEIYFREIMQHLIAIRQYGEWRGSEEFLFNPTVKVLKVEERYDYVKTEELVIFSCKKLSQIAQVILLRLCGD